VPTLLMLRAPGETSHTNWTPIFFVSRVRKAAPCVCVHLCIHGPQKNLKSSSLFPSTPQRRRGRHTQAAAFLAVAVASIDLLLANRWGGRRAAGRWG
jgi:hypothetical protein